LSANRRSDQETALNRPKLKEVLAADDRKQYSCFVRI
jgi:hypothetical protein